MSPELMMWFVLATKMAVTALFVTAATIIEVRLDVIANPVSLVRSGMKTTSESARCE